MLRELELIDFRGENTQTGKPALIQAQVIKNLDIHERPGVLTLRPGYDLQYEAPTLPNTLTNVTFLTFDIFFDKSFDQNGTEITVLYGKGTVNSADGVSDTLNSILCWIRPYWDGTQFVDEWKWLNEIIITEVTETNDSTYETQIKIAGNHSVNNWTIINNNNNQISQVITSVNDSTDTRINQTIYGGIFNVNDVVILMKNYIPLTNLTTLYNVTQEDYVFHRITNDIRVGFGGKSNRIGISTGGRTKYFDVFEYDYPNIAPDIVGTEEDFATIDEFILDPFNLFDTAAYGLDFNVISGSLSAGKYYFRLTGVLDDNYETLVYEQSITIEASKDIEISPWISLGAHNKRITALNCYYSSDGDTYNLLKTYQLSYNSYTPSSFKVDAAGRLILIDPTPELHTNSNAANISNESNSIGSWVEFGTTASGQASESIPGGVPSDYKYKQTLTKVLTPSNPTLRNGAYIPMNGLKQNTVYTISVYLETSVVAGMNCYVYFIDTTDLSLSGGDTPSRPQTTQAITNTLTQYTFAVDTGSGTGDIVGLAFTHSRDDINTITGTTKQLYIDELSVIAEDGSVLKNSTVPGLEMSVKMGYEPTFNVMRCWDDVEIFNGNAYYLNPFIDIRYENFIIKSHINSDIQYMFDVATLQEQLEIEKFDDQTSLSIQKIPGTYLLVLRDNGWLVVDPVTNAIIRNQFG